MQDASNSAPENECFMQYVLRLTEAVCLEYSKKPNQHADVLESEQKSEVATA